MVEIEKINALFGRDVTICHHCQSKCTIKIGTHPEYGDRPLVECAKCKANNSYPWDLFLIFQEEES